MFFLKFIANIQTPRRLFFAPKKLFKFFSGCPAFSEKRWDVVRTARFSVISGRRIWKPKAKKNLDVFARSPKHQVVYIILWVSHYKHQPMPKHFHAELLQKPWNQKTKKKPLATEMSNTHGPALRGAFPFFLLQTHVVKHSLMSWVRLFPAKWMK